MRRTSFDFALQQGLSKAQAEREPASNEFPPGTKITIVHGRLDSPGGAERLAIEELRYFRHVCKAELLTFKIDPRVASYAHSDASGIYQLSSHRLPGTLGEVLALRNRLRKIRPQVMICTQWGGWLHVYLATFGLGIPYVLNVHGTSFWFEDPADSATLVKYSWRYRRVFHEIWGSLRGHREFTPENLKLGPLGRVKVEALAKLDSMAVNKAKAVVVLTDRVGWEVLKMYGKESVVARGCLDEELLGYRAVLDVRRKHGIPEQSFLVMTVGRLDPRKRVDVLLRAFAIAKKRMPDAHLAVVGEGPDSSRLKRLSEELGIAGDTLFTGFVKEERLWDYYAACDVFVFAGWSTSPITTYEALAFHKPVVWSSEADEPADVLKDPGVFVVDPEPEQVADAIVRARGARSTVDVRNYTWGKYFGTVARTISMSVN
jgi:glycosyltransferase involved in cell wall biosynthesis